MIIPSTDFEGAVKTLAAFLDTKSGLDPNKILNADSIRGTDLSQMISSSQSYSPNVSSSFMLFELVENQNEEYFATKTEDEAGMMTIQTYDFHMMLYGNSSPDDAQRVFSLFKQGDNALALRNEGVFVVGVNPIEALNEFVNNTLLLRRDIIVKIRIRREFIQGMSDCGEFDPESDVFLKIRKLPND